MGLPEPPPLGQSALPPGTFDGTVVLVTGGGTGLGKAIGSEFARLGASIAIASRKPEHLAAGKEAIEGARRPLRHRRLRHPRARQHRRARSMQVEAELGPVDVLINNAAANFPVPAEDMSPNAWRTVVDITLNGTFFCAREFGRRHLSAGTPGSIVNIGASYAWTGRPRLRPLGGGQGRRQEHGRVAGRRVGALRHPGERSGARAVPPRRHDRRHPRATSIAPTRRTPASRPCGSVAPASSAGRPPS